jgi:hypothetical protein
MTSQENQEKTKDQSAITDLFAENEEECNGNINMETLKNLCDRSNNILPSITFNTSSLTTSLLSSELPTVSTSPSSACSPPPVSHPIYPISHGIFSAAPMTLYNNNTEIRDFSEWLQEVCRLLFCTCVYG